MGLIAAGLASRIGREGESEGESESELPAPSPEQRDPPQP
jgi:hypothetical protein